MNPLLLKFKTIAAQAAYQARLSMRVFISDHGLHDFLIDANTRCSGPAEIAAYALQYFCLEGGKFNGFLVGVQTAIAFLDEHLTGPAQKQQCLVDLKDLLNAGASYQQLLGWVQSYYR
jgi:hypothetical protein